MCKKMRLAFVLLMIHQATSSLTSDLYCQLTLVDSSIRQPYSGRRCVETEEHDPIIQIAYVVNQTYFCPSNELCNCNTTNKLTTFIDSIILIKLECPTLRTELTKVKCSCCHGYEEDHYHACIHIDKDDELSIQRFPFVFSKDPEFQTPSSSSLPSPPSSSSPPPPSSSSSSSTIIACLGDLGPNVWIVIIIVLISLFLLFIVIIIIICCLCPCGLLTKKRKLKVKKSSNEFTKRAVENVYSISNFEVKIPDGDHNEELEDNKHNETVKIGDDGCYDNVYSIVDEKIWQR